MIEKGEPVGNIGLYVENRENSRRRLNGSLRQLGVAAFVETEMAAVFVDGVLQVFLDGTGRYTQLVGDLFVRHSLDAAHVEDIAGAFGELPGVCYYLVYFGHRILFNLGYLCREVK